MALGVSVFAAVTLLGLFYVKWFPYYHRAGVAAAQHAIGNSIVMGTHASAPAASMEAAWEYAWAYGKAIWQAMVLGLLLGSGVQALLPAHWVARVLGGRGFGSVVKGGLMSLPGMMCTCCAAPVVAGLRARKASAGAAVAFWLGNTVLNPATLIFMGFVLGWGWTALRLVLGLIMVLGVGYVINRYSTPAESQAVSAAVTQTAPGNALSAAEDDSRGPFARWLAILARMTLKLVPEYIVLVLVLGAARAVLFPHVGPHVDNSVWWVVGLALAGTVFVIPTAGEVPIIQAMMAFGMAAGPAGALLMTLPPVSVPSLVMLSRSFPRHVLVLVTGIVIAFGILGGVLAAIFL